MHQNKWQALPNQKSHIEGYGHNGHNDHYGRDEVECRLACLELPQLCLDFLDVSPIPLPDPALCTGAPHLGVGDGHAAAIPGDSGCSGSERRGMVHQGGEYEFCRDGFAEGSVDLIHLFAFGVRFLLSVKEGVGGGGDWTHREVIKEGRQRGGERTELRLADTMVIGGDHDWIKVKNEGRGTMDVLGATGNWHGVGGREAHEG